MSIITAITRHIATARLGEALQHRAMLRSAYATQQAGLDRHIDRLTSEITNHRPTAREIARRVERRCKAEVLA